MSKPKKQSREEKLTGEEHRARVMAANRNLFILFEGPRGSRVWRIYAKATGKVVGFYTPSTNHHNLGANHNGRGLDADAVLDLAGRIAAE